MSNGRQRFSISPAAAVTDRRLEPRDLQVLCLLGRHTDNRGWCCRSQVKMARELACGRATVQRSLTRLVEAGYLEHRVIYRDSGADAAHEYRVLLDTRDGADFPHLDGGEISHYEDGAHTWAGVPTGGQGCPPKDGQGVPTHERAPMLTTPVKRKERERARENEEFEAARKAWPTGFADSRGDALAAWCELGDEDRRDAATEIDRYISTTKAVGRNSSGPSPVTSPSGSGSRCPSGQSLRAAQSRHVNQRCPPDRSRRRSSGRTRTSTPNCSEMLPMRPRRSHETGSAPVR